MLSSWTKIVIINIITEELSLSKETVQKYPMRQKYYWQKKREAK